HWRAQSVEFTPFAGRPPARLSTASTGKTGRLWKSIRCAISWQTSRRAPTRSGGIFDYATKRERLTEVERELEDPTVWNNPERAQSLGRERAQLEAVVTTVDTLDSGFEDS